MPGQAATGTLGAGGGGGAGSNVTDTGGGGGAGAQGQVIISYVTPGSGTSTGATTRLITIPCSTPFTFVPVQVCR